MKNKYIETIIEGKKVKKLKNNTPVLLTKKQLMGIPVSKPVIAKHK